MVIRYFLALILALSSVTGFAQTQSDAEALAEQVRANAQRYENDAFIRELKTKPKAVSPEQRKELIQLSDQTQAKVSKIEVVPGSASMKTDLPGTRYRVFVSQAQSGSELSRIAGEMKPFRAASMVFSGYRPGQKPRDFIKALLDLQLGNKASSITLDPPAFTVLKVTHVPVVAAYNDSGEAIAWVSGTASIAYLNRMIANGRRGNLGNVGPVVAVAEFNLADAMRARMAKVDWAARKRVAINAFWKNIPAMTLPAAQKKRTRRINPSFVVNKPIVAPDGKILVMAGQTINPLKVFPFTQHLLIFDATDPQQVIWAKVSMRNLKNERVRLIATRLPVNSPESYDRFTTTMGMQVTLLSDAIKTKFAIQSLPSRVRAKDGYFYVDEFVVRPQK